MSSQNLSVFSSSLGKENFSVTFFFPIGFRALVQKNVLSVKVAGVAVAVAAVVVAAVAVVAHQHGPSACGHVFGVSGTGYDILKIAIFHMPFAATLVQHAFGRTLFDVAPGDISLGVGAPDATLLAAARDVYLESVAEALQQPLSHDLLQYGPTRGDGGFLTELAEFLSRQYNDVVQREQLVVTSGASFGLMVLCQLFARPGQALFTADPCYFISRDIFRDAGLRIVSVDSDEDGMDMAALERALQDHAGQTSTLPFNALIYLVPTHCNPTSTTLPLERRRQLIRLAYKYQCLVVCDDVYDMLTFPGSGPTPPRIVALDTPEEGPGCVISNGTFSKIFGPGVRLGWMEGRESLLSVVANSGVYYSGGSPNHLTSGIFRVAMQTQRIDRLLVTLRNTYSERAAAFCAVLREANLRFKQPLGGFFVWVSAFK